MKSLYVGKKRALIFPAMCDGYLRIDYSDQVAGQAHGIFGHDDSFTIEAVITPYDLNGSGYKVTDADNPAGESGVVDSVKTFPNVQDYNTTEAQFQDYLYSRDIIRMSSAMSLFHSPKVKLELLNSTTTTHNQPAEYKIRFSVYANGLDTLTSDVIISPRILSTGTTAFTQVESGATVQHAYDSSNDEIKYHQTTVPVASHVDGANAFAVSGTSSHYHYVGQKLYRLTGTTFTSIGEVTAVLGSNVTLSETVTPSLAGAVIYTDTYREAPYLLTSCHIAAAYDAGNGSMRIYYDGKLLTKKIHSTAGTFAFDEEDLYIGQDPDTGVTTQFFGEIHEFSVLGIYKTEYNSIFTLAPNYRDVLLYYRFEEVDL
jgi:hypothetical protein